MSELAKMAIAAMRAGEITDPKLQAYDYSHLLDPKHREAGYRLMIHEDGGNSKWPVLRAVLQQTKRAARWLPVGEAEAQVGPVRFGGERHVRIESTFVEEDHRGKGLGTSLYEALVVHAHHNHQATHVAGDVHSTAAHNTHIRLAQKHGMKYQAPPSGEKDQFVDEQPGAYDNAYGPYRYTIKSESWVRPSGALSLPRPVVTLSDMVYRGSALLARHHQWREPRYLEPEPVSPLIPLTSEDLKLAEEALEFEMMQSKRNLNDYEEIASNMLGFDRKLFTTLEAAQDIMGAEQVPYESVRKALRTYGEDYEAVALTCYRLVLSEKNREALRAVLDSDDLAKGNAPSVDIQKLHVTPGDDESVDVAEAIQRGINAGELNSVKLSGKHSKGAMLVRNPDTHQIYLLKPGSGKNSPALGINEERATQSERETAFYRVADYAGLGGCYPRCDLVLIDGHQTAALELLPVDYKNMGEKKEQEPNSPPRILEPYRQNAVLFKWAALDYILGNVDRHSQNIMVSEDGKKVMLIDHGSTFAGRSFDPAQDEDSFIPYYLRAWTGRKFSLLSPRERVALIPHLSEDADSLLEEWINRLDPHRIGLILSKYHIDPRPSIERLEWIRAYPGSKSEALAKLWSGAL